jgi:predicted acylesterase/phospholipase RssA
LNGTFVSFNDNFKTKDLLEVLKASVSYPGIFSPHTAWESLWFSGSAIWNIDVSAPVLRCKSMGFNESDIVLDIILDSAPTIEEIDAAKFNTFQMAKRSMDVVNYYSARDGILNAQKAYPQAYIRNIIGPNQSWTSFDMRTFF